ncbi:MAG: 3-phosphoserine/phosphohydroxythreonine transaminase [Gammaproteobacteria bacterium]|jgi:phosphoserine aminotransferase|nr:3-phosphoserine/phosphohydroxythreonine aminotransferase [Gammaproteobacteria bacterium]MDP6094591.1 3-phosphoserine/phosphohydroxythreonine transaminase [Gammaproteobacteria bacterium]MDP7455195.1 3-phosphoserine/phosphohydroxythreonine transaminase [Gammaproteobacteria bacterium]|tara:strand:+ start:340 stop:1428 length:1089 start_codon:yes stop_codon:yes gene_type:complete
MTQVFNFGAGPAMLPIPVMQKVQQEFLDYRGMGASIIEISHRSKDFDEVINQTDALLAELANIPDNYKILYVHGGAQMQFSAVPMNLIGRKAARKAAYVESGNFAKLAQKEAVRYGDVSVVASSEASNYDYIPEFRIESVGEDTSYIHITSNNTIYGTRWQQFPDTGEIPLVADMTSELLSRKIDISQFGIIFAGLQKNLGPAGLACVIIREDLLDYALPETPNLLNYKTYADKHSLANTNNTFAIYMMRLVLEWLKDQGGVDAIETQNEHKASILYNIIDNSEFYVGVAQTAHRSTMNVPFNLANDDLLGDFLEQALANGLYALKGHRNVGGARASIYNAMPVTGCEALAEFMQEFERTNS